MVGDLLRIAVNTRLLDLVADKLLDRAFWRRLTVCRLRTTVQAAHSAPITPQQGRLPHSAAAYRSGLGGAGRFD
jgi:hypothetical protein